MSGLKIGKLNSASAPTTTHTTGTTSTTQNQPISFESTTPKITTPQTKETVTEKSVQTDPSDTAVTTNPEKLTSIEKYAQENGYEGKTLEEVVSILLQKEAETNLDEIGAKVLKEYREATQDITDTKKDVSSNQEVKETNTANDDPTDLIPESELQSTKHKRKNYNEQVKTFTEALLKDDEKYKNLPPDQKDVYATKQMNKLLKAAFPKRKDGPVCGDEVGRLYVIAETLKNTKTSIEKFAKMKSNEQRALIGKYRSTQMETKITKLMETLVPETERKSEAWKKMSATDKLDLYVERYFKTTEYYKEGMSQADIKKGCADLKNKFINSFLPKHIQELPEVEKTKIIDSLYAKAAITMDALELKNISFKDYEKMTPQEQNNIMEEYYTNKGIELPPEIQVTNKLIAEYKEINGADKEPSYEDLIVLLKNKAQQETITDEEKNLLKTFLGAKDLGANLKNLAGDFRPTASEMYIAKHGSKNGVPSQNEIINSYIIKNKNNKVNIEQTEKMFSQIKLSSSDFKVARNQLKALGLDDATIDRILHLNETQKAIYGSHYHQQKDLDGAIAITTMMSQKMGCAYTKKSQGVFEGKALDKYNIETLKSCPQYTRSIAEGQNEYIKDVNVRAKHMHTIASCNELSDSTRAQYSYDAVVTATNDSDKVIIGKTLSTVDNPAVTEGLAAASKSISDPGARQQYDSYVDNAMKNYPPEQQAAIRQARETGEISSSTLSQTNTSNGKPIESSNSNSGSNAGSNVAANSNSANGTGTTSTPSAANNTGSNNASQPSGASPASSNQSQGSAINQTAIYTTNQATKNSVTGQAAGSNNRTVYASASGLPTASVSASKTHISNNPSAINDESAESAELTSKTLPTISPEETQKLKDEAQVLMDKIEKFMETQAESIQEYEEQQAQKLEDRFEDIIAELTSETEVYSDPNIAKYENLPQELKEDVKEYFKDLYEKNGINAIYNALDGNKKDSFVEKLASSKSHEAIMAFANEHRSDKSIIRTLFKYSQNSELIRFMDSSDIIDLYMKGQIQDINLIKNNSEALAKIIELQLKGGEEPRNLKGLYSLLTAEYQSDILANYPTLAEEIPGTDAHYAKYIQSMKTAPSANPNPAITQVKPDSGMITLENAIEGDETAHPYIYDKGDGHSVTLPFGRDYDRQKKKGHIYFA